MSSQYAKLKKLRRIFHKSLFTLAERLKHKYAHQGGQEAALWVSVMAQAAEDGDLEYFESDLFRDHCDLIPNSFELEVEDLLDTNYPNFIVDLSRYIAHSNVEMFLNGCRGLYFIREVS